MEYSSLKLIIVQGPREGETLEFKPGTGIRIGRVVRGNTLPIKDAGISTKHLSLDFESGKWVIRDLDSSNGTLLNNSKLTPFTPFDLRHGDAIKIGEYTSIEVKIENKIEDDGESRLRRNPKRGLTAKNEVKGLINEDCDEKLENEGPVVENRGRRVGTRRGKGLKDEKKEAEFGNVESVMENRGRQVGAKRGRGFRGHDTAVDLDLDGGKCGGELEDVVVVTKSKRGRGRQKKVQVLKNEDAEDLCKVHNLEGKGNASAGAEEPVQQVNLNEEQLVSDSMLQKISKCSCLAYRELEIEDKRAQEVLRRKRNLGNEASEIVDIDVEEEGLEAVEIVVSEEKGNVEGMDLGRDMCKESASGSGVKKSCIEADLEKMTLGEWFDYLETHLPKQICNVTEEMIASMREKAARFHEFMVHQMNEKGKLPVC